MTRSALVVVVLDASTLVGEARAAHDPMAAVGVPPHVTVLYPFREDPDNGTRDAVAALCAELSPFDASLDAVRRFEGGVVWLRPAPTDAFVAMAQRVAAAFPDCAPYGGRFPDPVPHLTVAQSVSPATAAALEADLGPGLPIDFAVTELSMLTEDEDDTWRLAHAWTLGRR